MMYQYIKRFFDILVSLIALLILSPFFLIIIIMLKLSGEGEILYKQKRLGFHNRYFNIYKFATMLKNSLNMSSGSITLRNDPRVTSVGKYLRITKFNELPQVINVLKGDMSIVGPRPLVDKTFNAYSKEIRDRVYNTKPGITGIGSIVFRDEEELISASVLPPHDFYEQYIAPYKGELEIWYQQHQSFQVDLLIIFLTVWVILFPKSRLTYKIFSDLPKRKLIL